MPRPRLAVERLELRDVPSAASAAPALQFLGNMHDEFNKMLHKTLGRSSGNSSFKFKVTTKPYRERSISPTYKEHKVDSALTCHECGIRFQVDGIFGFCPKCRAEHRQLSSGLQIDRWLTPHHNPRID